MDRVFNIKKGQSTGVSIVALVDTPKGYSKRVDYFGKIKDNIENAIKNFKNRLDQVYVVLNDNSWDLMHFLPNTYYKHFHENSSQYNESRSLGLILPSVSSSKVFVFNATKGISQKINKETFTHSFVATTNIKSANSICCTKNSMDELELMFPNQGNENLWTYESFFTNRELSYIKDVTENIDKGKLLLFELINQSIIEEYLKYKVI